MKMSKGVLIFKLILLQTDIEYHVILYINVKLADAKYGFYTHIK